MTRDRDFKRLVRSKAELDQISYTEARRRLGRASEAEPRFVLHTIKQWIVPDPSLSREHVDDLIADLGPSNQFFSIERSHEHFILIAHNGSYSPWNLDDQRSTLMYRLEYQYGDDIRVALTSDVDLVRSFVNGWIADDDVWPVIVSRWSDARTVATTPYKPPSPRKCARHADPPHDSQLSLTDTEKCPVCAADEGPITDELLVGRWWSRSLERPATHYGWSPYARWAFKPEPQDGSAPFLWMKSGGKPTYVRTELHGRLLAIHAAVQRVAEPDGRIWHRIIRSTLAPVDVIPEGVSEEMALEALQRLPL